MSVEENIKQIKEMSLEEISSLFQGLKANLVAKYRQLEEEGKKEESRLLRVAWCNLDASLWEIDIVIAKLKS